ncbi:carbohydrate binding module family 6 [Nitzschia inconspicua]|uniref:Carbohydrate binding module family 6 n=1 Tax=Nitzschia inconspicua TaxID=303405 RepID=A0A9K3PL24_9STRA|nr:carbohydrate binding module family 6 [Nitzschia inconspicua]
MCTVARIFLLCNLAIRSVPVLSLNGGRSMIETSNGWKAIEVVTEGDQLSDSWRLRNLMDGMGAYLVDGGKTLRILVNHEREGTDATISEININKAKLKEKIRSGVLNQIGDVEFVESISRAFSKWTRDGDWLDTEVMDWRTESNFCRFCSSQSYEANTFGSNRGFVDRVYITGEECSGGRLFVLHAATREMYQLSGVTGGWKNGAGRGGIPFDSFENAALVDTGDSTHIALLLSADGGSKTMKLYIGKKGFDADGNFVGNASFLARNGLLYGEWHYLGTVSGSSRAQSGAFVTDKSKALHANKFEDIDTNPLNPKQVVLAESYTGVFILEFTLVIDDEKGLKREESKFTIQQVTDFDIRSYQYPDNVDWTRDNLIFVNRDTGDGGIFYMSPNGNGKTTVGRTVPNAESTGILDLSQYLSYPPSSVMITTNQGSPSSMTVLLNPTLKDVIDMEQEEDTATETQISVSSAGTIDCPATTNGKIQVIQAEDSQYFVDAKVITTADGYCGDAYIGFGEVSDVSGIVFEVDTTSSGRHLLSFRYSNASPSPLPGALMVNGDEQDVGFAFVSTGESWSEWGTESKMVELSGGRNYMELWWTSYGTRPNLDWMSVQFLAGLGDGSTNQDCINASNSDYLVVVEAEDTFFSSASVVAKESDYCGIGYLDFAEDSASASLFLRIESPSFASYKVSVRYANGGPLPRPGSCLIDGKKIKDSFSFRSTGSWSIWNGESVKIQLIEGSHMLEIFWDGNSKRPNIDQISITLKRTFRPRQSLIVDP